MFMINSSFWNVNVWHAWVRKSLQSSRASKQRCACILHAKLPKRLQSGFHQTETFEKNTIRRSLLYVPGHDRRKLEKVMSLNVDCAVLDCEDGVAIDCKESARLTISEEYSRLLPMMRGELAVRINAPDSPFIRDDITTIFSGECFPRSVVLPKINSPDQLTWVMETLEEATRSTELKLIVMVESARALIDIKEILASTKNARCRVDALIFGSDDFCADLGIARSLDASELMYARQKLVVVAKAFGIGVIDMVYIDYNDSAGLARQATEGFRMGFTGKQVIHPSQIPIVQNAFSPTPEQVAWARELLAAYQDTKQGVFTFRGQMIDRPTLLQAHNVINSTSCDT